MASVSPARHLPSVAGITGALLLAAVCGVAISLGDSTAALLCTALVLCVFILLDFRVGVVLLIVLMPLSASTLFPHEMAGIKGLNPLNALLLGLAAASYGLGDLNAAIVILVIVKPF